MSQRNTLLLAQILHTNNIYTPEQLKVAPAADIERYIYKLVNHKLNQVNGEPVTGVNTKDDLVALFEKELAEWKVSTSEDLANASYFKRIEVLEQQLADNQVKFSELLQ